MKARAAIRTRQQAEVVNQQNRKNDDDEKFTHALGQIEDYSVSIRLGRGKYSNVFRGHQKDGSLCVVKVLKPVKISKINREIKILEDLRGGPYISQLLDVVRDKDTKSIALILDWADNVKITSTFYSLTVKDIAIYMYKVLKALEFAHSKGIMHRDIKPGNIMYSPETNSVHVIDWGLAEFYNPGTSYPVRVATRHYKGPELLLNFTQYNCSLDIWCLGCTLAGILFQKVPFFKGSDNDDQILKMGEIFGGNKIIAYAEKYNLRLSQKLQATLCNYQGKTWSSYVKRDNKKVATPEALDLLSKMLTIDHNERPTATQALNHPFFNIIRNEV
ncbi:hypothetical protein M9Y10_012525 [Tritrichomonas musculus]|uniref:non-specific serine/threonine protein kinase n=1 Tax=Tritrichomonas musculus TaxID=1915356 RepID=A0ABR2IDU1_9EUKA